MPAAQLPLGLSNALAQLDPRRSLMAGTIWLIFALAASFSVAAALWVGSLARENILQQHMRRLSLETDELAAEAAEAIAARLGAIRAAATLVGQSPGPRDGATLESIYRNLESAYPEFEWLAAADETGRVVAARDARLVNTSVGSEPWFTLGSRAPWLGEFESPDRLAAASDGNRSRAVSSFGSLTAPVHDSSGALVGVVAARLSWRRAPDHLTLLTEASDPREAAQALLLDRAGIVVVGPRALRGRAWPGAAIMQRPAPASAADNYRTPRFERLPDGRTLLVARTLVGSAGGVQSLGWQAQLGEPKEHVFQRADALALSILWVSLGLGAATVLAGALGARHLTRRLEQLTHSAVAVGGGEARQIEIPVGRDEVARLGAAFASVLEDLNRERSELRTLSGELERRVAVRTREVERLAEESRYAAIVRERLKLARDLHDTLAHSMMAMLSEVRLLRKLHALEPGALGAELERAEQVARAGLVEARTAISQMRLNAVRDTGLGAALATAFERFIDRTGVAGHFSADPAVAHLGDERAETLYRIAEEALRNVERHAGAANVRLTLTTADGSEATLCVEDDGVGFDPSRPTPGHFGLVGLREQAQLIGARLEITSAPNEGTRVSISLRVAPEALQILPEPPRDAAASG